MRDDKMAKGAVHYKCIASSFIGDNWSKVFIARGASMPRANFRIFINVAGNLIECFHLILFIHITLQNVPIPYAPKYIPVAQLK